LLKNNFWALSLLSEKSNDTTVITTTKVTHLCNSLLPTFVQELLAFGFVVIFFYFPVQKIDKNTDMSIFEISYDVTLILNLNFLLVLVLMF